MTNLRPTLAARAARPAVTFNEQLAIARADARHRSRLAIAVLVLGAVLLACGVMWLGRI